MKTTLDLPDPLMREIKIRAARENRKLKEIIAELLNLGLKSPGQSATGSSTVVRIDPVRGIPILRSSPGAPASRLTAEDLIALEQSALEEIDILHVRNSL